MIFCNNCGSMCDPNSKFCPNCGGLVPQNNNIENNQNRQQNNIYTVQSRRNDMYSYQKELQRTKIANILITMGILLSVFSLFGSFFVLFAVASVVLCSIGLANNPDRKSGGYIGIVFGVIGIIYFIIQLVLLKNV